MERCTQMQPKTENNGMARDGPRKERRGEAREGVCMCEARKEANVMLST